MSEPDIESLMTIIERDRHRQPRLIWQQGRVVDVEAGNAKIEMEPANHCARCLEGRGCGAGVFSRLLARRTVHLVLPDPVGLSSGMMVQVGVSSMALVGASLRLYGLPLAGFVGGLALAHAAGPAGLAGDLTGLAFGLAGGVTLARWANRNPMKGLNPVIRLPRHGCPTVTSNA